MKAEKREGKRKKVVGRELGKEEGGSGKGNELREESKELKKGKTPGEGGKLRVKKKYRNNLEYERKEKTREVKTRVTKN